MNAIHLVLGGIRSGKSAYAEQLAADLAGGKGVIYLATGVATDPEMERRIRLHQERRPASWETLDVPLNPVGCLQQRTGHACDPPVLLLDSLDGWVTNLLIAHEQTPQTELTARIAGAVRRFASYAREIESDAVVVSSEVGQSLVATSSLGRQFQDLLGTVNQTMAAEADVVTLVVAGIPVPIKSSHLAEGGCGEGGDR